MQGNMDLADGYVLMCSILVGFALALAVFAWQQQHHQDHGDCSCSVSNDHQEE